VGLGMKYWDAKYKATKLKERLQRKIAWVLPRSIVMWAYIRVVSHATTGRWSNQVVPELGATEALERWDNEFAPAPIHYNLIDAHNYIKYAKRLEQKQTYARIIENSRLPRKVQHNGQVFKLKYADIDDGVYLSYVDDTVKTGKKGRVLMHYEESTLRDCITKAWRKLATEAVKVDNGKA
jgi:hypothetical protein